MQYFTFDYSILL